MPPPKGAVIVAVDVVAAAVVGCRGALLAPGVGAHDTVEPRNAMELKRGRRDDVSDRDRVCDHVRGRDRERTPSPDSTPSPSSAPNTHLEAGRNASRRVAISVGYSGANENGVGCYVRREGEDRGSSRIG